MKSLHRNSKTERGGGVWDSAAGEGGEGRP